MALLGFNAIARLRAGLAKLVSESFGCTPTLIHCRIVFEHCGKARREGGSRQKNRYNRHAVHITPVTPFGRDGRKDDAHLPGSLSEIPPA